MTGQDKGAKDGLAAGSNRSIVISHVSKTYETSESSIQALAPTELAIAAGEFVALLGPSGCGKTTLLRMIGGLLKPSDGSIVVAGHNIWEHGHRAAQASSDLGIVFQDANLFPWLTVEDNVAMPLQLRGISRSTSRARARELLELTGIAGFGRSWPRELSGGMRQRAAIARALSRDPSILLMDEPFGALDLMTRDAMNIELQRIWMETRKTIVIVTHSITEAVFLADRVVLLSSRPGRVSDIVSIPFERPRPLEIASSGEFQKIVAYLRERSVGASSHAH